VIPPPLFSSRTNSSPLLPRSRWWMERWPGQQARGFLGIHGVGGDQGFLGLAQLLLQAFGEQLLVDAGGGGLAGAWGRPGAGATLNRQVPERVAQGMFVGIIYVLSSRARIGFVLLRGFISCQQDHYLLSIPRLNWVANP